MSIDRLKYLLICLLLSCLTSFTAYSQSSEIKNKTDSLLEKAKKTHSIDKKIKLNIEAAGIYENNDKYKALQILKDAEKLLNSEAHDTSKYRLLNCLGYFYKKTSHVREAADSYNKAFRIFENTNDSIRISKSYFNLGLFNFYHGDKGLAKSYFKKAYNYLSEGTQPQKKCHILNGLAVIYHANKKFAKADSILHIAKKVISKSENGTKDLTAILSNISEMKWSMGQRDSAFIYLKRAHIINKKNDYKLGLAWTYYLRGKYYKEINKLKKADQSLTEAINIWEKINSLKDLTKGYDLLAKVKVERGLFQEAYKYRTLDKKANDSVFKKENIEHIQELEKKYESEKDSLKLANTELQLSKEKVKRAEERKNKQRQFVYFSIIGVILIVNIIYFFSRFRKEQKRKQIIEQQNIVLEEKNNEITDSIQYAKRLQDAILPSSQLFTENFESSFILFKPKDIVSGDFYWMEKTKHHTFIAAADCTGHGVPGAMVSVVCANALNKSVNELGNYDPADILDRTRRLVIDTFSKTGGEVKDGMDISLLAFNEKEGTAVWAGAYNPLWIISPNSHEIQEIKPDKQPVGSFGKELPFTSHQVDFKHGDCAYMFSDGFSDQFGGEYGKKMKKSNFKKLLLEHHMKNMPQQKKSLEIAFKEWKGNYQQVDDVCLIGLKL